jgi:hypothetical protein
MCKTPDQILSVRIFQKVQEQNLVSVEDFDRFTARFNNGSLSKEDIRLYIENRVESELHPVIDETNHE